MNLNDLLRRKEIDPKLVLVLRHKAREPELNRILPSLAKERPELFNAYQQSQYESVERAMTRAKYVASFIGHEPGKALFVGLYSNNGSRPITRNQFWRIRANKELKVLGMTGFTAESPRPSVLLFDLVLSDFYAHWKGKLIVNWPGLERSWWRWSDRNEISVFAILDHPTLDEPMPEWRSINLTWEKLKSLPSDWKSKLKEWRGIYYIYDSSNRKGYVGAAYGKDNLLGRWRNYAARGDGGNRLLKMRDPKNFQFTILERVSPDMEPDDVILLEATWKDRLHTRSPQGMNAN